MPLQDLVTRLRSIVEMATKPELSSDEKNYLGLMAKRMSDKKVRAAMKMTQDQAFRFAVALRAKLGLPDGGSLRDAGRALGLK